nr:alcohol dehydrogenase catalytic domain-containing protein [Streptomyces umbrinus]
MRATGVTPADSYLRSGILQDIVSLDFPHIPGLDAAGIVAELGEGVTGTAVGDAVFGLVPFTDLGGPRPSTPCWRRGHPSLGHGLSRKPVAPRATSTRPRAYWTPWKPPRA